MHAHQAVERPVAPDARKLFSSKEPLRPHCQVKGKARPWIRPQHNGIGCVFIKIFYPEKNIFGKRLDRKS